jgi:hypothetical protein
VVKVPDPHIDWFEECIHELHREREQYKVDPSFKKYLAKMYFYNRVVLVQEKVNPCKCKGFWCSSAERLADKYPISDYEHNHGLDQHGNIKFFDWVYKRTDYYLDNNVPLRR